MSEIISENNLIKGVLLGNNERGVFDYESLGNLPTINGNPAIGELTENLATKGEMPGVYVGQSAPTD